MKCRNKAVGQLSTLIIASILLTTSFEALAENPTRTTAVYEDWTVLCNLAENQKQCELVSTQSLPGQSSPFSQIIINHPKTSQPYKLVIQSPPNAWLQTGTKLIVGDSENVPATFKWCANSRCLSEGELSKAQIEKLASRADPASFTFKDAAQNDISVPVSVKGLASAFRMLESR
jgi:invasion protein IalB